jgi:hypothetical protein
MANKNNLIAFSLSSIIIGSLNLSTAPQPHSKRFNSIMTSLGSMTFSFFYFDPPVTGFFASMPLKFVFNQLIFWITLLETAPRFVAGLSSVKFESAVPLLLQLKFSAV